MAIALVLIISIAFLSAFFSVASVALSTYSRIWPPERSRVLQLNAPDPELSTSSYVDAIEDFDTAFRGPYALRKQSFDVLQDGKLKGERVLAVSPGVVLSPAQEAAVATVFVDVEVLTDGTVKLPMWLGKSRPTADELAAAEFASTWKFPTTGWHSLSLVKQVPVRILRFSSGVSGVVAFPGGSGCAKPIVRKSYQRGSWGRTTTDYHAEIDASGHVSFWGRGDVLIPAGASTVPSLAVRDLFKRVLSADLLQAGASIGVWAMTHSGHAGEFAVRCGEQTLLVVKAEASSETAPFDINAEVERLADTKRWSIGNDGTPGVLIKSSRLFRSLSVLRGVAQNGSSKGVVELAAGGMPLTDDAQKNVPLSERVNALEIMAQRGEVRSLQALLAAPVDWSKSQLTDALVIFAGGNADLPTMESLIKAGGDPRGSYGMSGRTVLMAAAAAGNPDIVERVLQFDKALDRADRERNLAIHYAVRGHVGLPSRFAAGVDQRLKVVSLLIAAGAKVDARGEHNSTALMHASWRPDIAELLLKNGADPDARDSLGRPPLMRWPTLETVKVLLKYGADVRAKGYRGETVLNSNAPVDAVPLLVAAGADVSTANDDGRTPLMLTTRNAVATRLLVAKGADVNARDRFGRTALMLCPVPEVAKILLEAGADPLFRDKFGKTAGDLAAGRTDECKGTSEVIADWVKRHPRWL
ncbi:MAG: ankyrin repeat domain-containing protein [Micropepsaceae bacterium]